RGSTGGEFVPFANARGPAVATVQFRRSRRAVPVGVPIAPSSLSYPYSSTTNWHRWRLSGEQKTHRRWPAVGGFKLFCSWLPDPPPTANGVHNDAVTQSLCAIERSRALA